MKRYGKILVLLIALAALLTAVFPAVSAEEGVASSAPAAPSYLPPSVTVTAADALQGATYVIYENVRDFNDDIENGVIDGMIDGENVLVTRGTETTMALPASGYVYLLADVTVPQVFKLSGGAVLQINCGRKKLTLGKVRNVISGSSLAIFNGALNPSAWATEGTLETTDTAAYIAFRDLDITTNDGYGSARFIWARSAVYGYFENLTYDSSAGRKRFIWLASNGTQDYTFKNVNITQNAKNPDPVVELAGQACNVSLYFDKDTKINSKLFNSALAAGSQLLVSAEVGCKIKNNDWILDPSLVSTNLKLDFISPLGVSARFVDVGGIFVLTEAISEILWHGVDGAPIGEKISIFEGDVIVPPELPKTVSEKEGGGYTVTEYVWAREIGGEAVDIDSLRGSVNLYAVAGEPLDATLALLGADGKLVDAWITDRLTKDTVSNMPAGSTLLMLADLSVDYGASADMTFDSYMGDITVDLGGHTLTHVSYDGKTDVAWATPAAGVTVTLQNGTVNISNSGGKYGTLVSGEGEGTIKFHRVDIVSAGGPAIVNLNAGSFIMELGRIDTNGSGTYRPFRIGNGATKAVTASLELYGVYHSGKGGDVFVSLYSARNANNNIKVVVGEYEGTYSWIKTGYMLQFSQANIGSASKYEFIYDGAYVYGGNAHVTGRPKWDSKAVDAALDEKNISFYFDNFIGMRPEADYFTSTTSVLLTTASINIDRALTTVYKGSEVYTVGGLLDPDFGLMSSLTLYSDLDLNLFIPVDVVGGINTISADGTLIFDRSRAEDYPIYVDRRTGERYYVASVRDIAPNLAAKQIELSINYSMCFTYAGESAETELNATVLRSFSVVDYIETLFDTEGVSETALDTARALSAYIIAAYDYFDVDSIFHVDTWEKLLDIALEVGAEEFVGSFGEIHAPEGDTDFGPEAGVTAQFGIGTVTRLELSFGAVRDYEIYSGAKLIAEGRADGVTLELHAYELCSSLVIKVDGNTATFSFAEYIEMLLDGTDMMRDRLLRAMYAYGRCAELLRAEQLSSGLL
ncbi:MAG: hypothetical protein IKA64_05510 [Clostridia bacterium]|nr:hypothetical protein [Clostridia bacterium]